MAANFTPVLVAILSLFGVFMVAMAYAQWTGRDIDLTKPE
jgi:hypothetical protein